MSILLRDPWISKFITSAKPASFSQLSLESCKEFLDDQLYCAFSQHKHLTLPLIQSEQAVTMPCQIVEFTMPRLLANHVDFNSMSPSQLERRHVECILSDGTNYIHALLPKNSITQALNNKIYDSTKILACRYGIIFAKKYRLCAYPEPSQSPKKKWTWNLLLLVTEFQIVSLEVGTLIGNPTNSVNIEAVSAHISSVLKAVLKPPPPPIQSQSMNGIDMIADEFTQTQMQTQLAVDDSRSEIVDYASMFKNHYPTNDDAVESEKVRQMVIDAQYFTPGANVNDTIPFGDSIDGELLPALSAGVMMPDLKDLDEPELGPTPGQGNADVDDDMDVDINMGQSMSICATKSSSSKDILSPGAALPSGQVIQGSVEEKVFCSKAISDVPPSSFPGTFASEYRVQCPKFSSLQMSDAEAESENVNPTQRTPFSSLKRALKQTLTIATPVKSPPMVQELRVIACDHRKW